MASLTISPDISPKRSPERSPVSPNINNLYEVSIKGEEPVSAMKERLDIISTNVSSLERDKKDTELMMSATIDSQTRILEDINHKQTITSTIMAGIASMIAFAIAYPFLKR